MFKYFAVLLVATTASVFQSNWAYSENLDWRNIPTRPPFQESANESPLGEFRQLAPLERTYDDYGIGEIDLDTGRLRQLVNLVQFQIRGGNRLNFSADKMSIAGYADEIPVANHEVIRQRLPESMGIPYGTMITNKDVARGRAISISERLRRGVGYQLPTSMKIDGIDGLPIGSENRRIEVMLKFVLDGGIKRIRRRPWRMN